ncbi:MAG: carbohydrate kinase [Bacteroidota bacterium]
MKTRFDVTSVGEAFVDLVSMTAADNLAKAESFVKVAGGAPANVAVGVAKMGLRSAFVGKIGDDSFGHFVKAELKRLGVEVRGLVSDGVCRTRLAFVSVSSNGERDFEFWERHPADQELQYSDVAMDLVLNSAIVNIGSFLLLNDPARSVAFRVAREAGRKGCEICFDPNARLSLWPSEKAAVKQFRQMVSMSSIVRMNDSEAKLLTGFRNVEKAADSLRALGPNLVFITLAERGCFAANDQWQGLVPGFNVNVVDTTGCGDGFLVGILTGIRKSGKKPVDLTGTDLRNICRLGNAVGALTSRKRGAIAALPELKEVKSFLGDPL